MAKTVVSLFGTREQAEKAIRELRNRGFEKEISVIAKDEGKQARGRDIEAGEEFAGRENETNKAAFGGDTLADGGATGGILGGLAGLAMGAGALTIPGLGPIIAAGPIAGMLSGIAGGGIAGALVDWGIPQERGQFFEEEVRKGNVLVSVSSDNQRADEAAEILRRFGGKEVESHKK